MRHATGSRKLDWLTSRPIAHRGLHNASEGVIENTEPAFAAAVAFGYAIECDIRLSADKQPVVFHDATLDRLMNATGAVGTRTVQELKRIDFKKGADRIQTLHELLEQVNDRVPLVIEIKSGWRADPTLAIQTVDAVKTYRGRFCLMSFDPDIVETVRLLAPDVTRGIVADRVSDKSWRPLPLARRLELRHFLHWPRTAPHFISFDERGLPWPPVALARDAGMPVISWTVKSEAQASAVRRYSDQITFEGFLP